MSTPDDHPPELESDDDDSGDWEEWQATGVQEDNDEDDEEEEAAQCPFCTTEFPSPKAVFRHCSEVHSFDLPKTRADAHLDIYDTLRLINFIRTKAAETNGWSAQAIVDLQNSLVDTKQKGAVSFEWKDDKYLTPVLDNDPLLYSFDDEEGDADEFNAAEKSMALQELLGASGDSPSSSSSSSSKAPMESNDLADLTKVFESLGVGLREDLATPVDVADDQNSSNGASKKKDKKGLKVTFAEVAKRELRDVNKNYFGSYSAFGIHREMLSDKVRTDAYRDAIVANPSLLKNAVVMDVGCGTGILSLFAAQAGASKVIAIDGSSKMAAVASQIAKDNGFLKDAATPEGVMTVVSGMIEELDTTMPAEVHGVDVIVSEWMGYCLLFESMLPSVLHARDRWLKPGGAILPDTAEMYVAGFGKGGTSLPFWENVYGFNMKCVGDEVVRDATQNPIIDVVDTKDVVTTSSLIQAFDLATMKAEDTDFTAEFKLELLPETSKSGGATTWCYGLVIWFDNGFTARFCKEKPVVLTTSPHSPKTHWSQTILTFKQPIALCAHDVNSSKGSEVGSEACPARAIHGRISIARSHRHRSIDISLETSAVSSSNVVRTWPVQMFDI